MDEREHVGRFAFLQRCMYWFRVDGGSGEFRKSSVGWTMVREGKNAEAISACGTLAKGPATVCKPWLLLSLILTTREIDKMH